MNFLHETKSIYLFIYWLLTPVSLVGHLRPVNPNKQVNKERKKEKRRTKKERVKYKIKKKGRKEEAERKKGGGKGGGRGGEEPTGQMHKTWSILC